MNFIKFSSVKEINKIPVIEPNNIIKEKPEELELFPHSDSSIWDEFKKNTNEQKAYDQEQIILQKR